MGTLLLRMLMEDRESAARFAAVLGIIDALDIPLVHFSVLWWRTLHQPPTLLGPGPTPMDPAFVLALIVNLVAFVLLYGYFTAKRVRDRKSTRLNSSHVRISHAVFCLKKTQRVTFAEHLDSF